MPIPEDIKKKIQENLNKKLQEKGRNLVCPICGNNNFILADGFVNELLQETMGGGLVIGGPAIPEVVIICGHCGYAMKFSSGILGLLPDKFFRFVLMINELKSRFVKHRMLPFRFSNKAHRFPP